MLTVELRTTDQNYFKGWFTQAQKSGVTNNNYGTFQTTYIYSQTYECFNNNAVSHLLYLPLFKMFFFRYV